MKLSTKTRYSARILIELALNRGTVLQVNRIAASQKIPAKYLEQLLRKLKMSGLVTSVRGPKGGHLLAQAPETISLGQLVRLFEGQADLVECVSAPEICDMAADCQIRRSWIEATSVMYEKLDNTSIADLAQRALQRNQDRTCLPEKKRVTAKGRSETV